jgi:hypothetical protein
MITAEDFYISQSAEEYTEPDDNYVIVKITEETISLAGNIYEATRAAWAAKYDKAKKYKYVLAVVYGIVREVYEVEKWIQLESGRIAFEGHPSNGPLLSLKGMLIPQKYRRKGAANPFMYKK